MRMTGTKEGTSFFGQCVLRPRSGGFGQKPRTVCLRGYSGTGWVPGERSGAVRAAPVQAALLNAQHRLPPGIAIVLAADDGADVLQRPLLGAPGVGDALDPDRAPLAEDREGRVLLGAVLARGVIDSTVVICPS